jgi:hypothetical protein
MESYNDKVVAELLINSIEEWAKPKGMEAIVSSLAFSDKDTQSMMIEGFDQPLIIATNGNWPYQAKLIENRGYNKHHNMFEYKIIIPQIAPEFYKRIFERKIANGKIQVLELKSRNQLHKYIIPLLTLLNETFKDIYAFTPLTHLEM